MLGVGHPALFRRPHKLGVDSADSSSFVRNAVEGGVWNLGIFRNAENFSDIERAELAMIKFISYMRSFNSDKALCERREYLIERFAR